MSLLNILQWEMNFFLVAFILILLMPLSSHQKVRYYGCFIAFIFSMSLSAVVLIPVFVFRLRDVRNYIFGWELMKHISKLVGIQWEPRGADILEVERGAVVVVNHQSIFDTLGGLSLSKTMGRCVMVGRKELFYIWPFGLGAWMAGTVFIDRNRPKEANGQLDDASRFITKEKAKLWMYPEGTRNKNPDTLLPFKKGAFRIAVNCQVPIIPIVFSPYYFIDHEKKYFGQGRVIIQSLEPVFTEGKTEQDIDSIMEEVRGKMVKQYDLLKQEVLAQKEAVKTLVH